MGRVSMDKAELTSNKFSGTSQALSSASASASSNNVHNFTTVNHDDELPGRFKPHRLSVITDASLEEAATDDVVINMVGKSLEALKLKSSADVMINIPIPTESKSTTNLLKSRDEKESHV